MEIEDLKEAMEEVVRETKLGFLRNGNRGNLEGIESMIGGLGEMGMEEAHNWNK